MIARNIMISQSSPFDNDAVAFGDSITVGVYVEENEAYFYLIAEAMGWTNTVNSGVSGSVLQNTPQNSQEVIGGAVVGNGRDNLLARVLDHNPRRVIILYGTNDFRFGDPAFSDALYQNDLIECIQLMIANGAFKGNIYLGSVPIMAPDTYGIGNSATAEKEAAYVAAAAAAATITGVNYIDVNAAMNANGGVSLLLPDGVHPNAAGHIVIANAFLSLF